MALTPRGVVRGILVFFLLTSLPAFCIRKQNPGSSQNGMNSSIPNCPSESNTPNFAVLNGAPSGGCPALGSRVFTLTDPNSTFTVTVTPALWANGFSSGSTIFNVQLMNLSSGQPLTLTSLVVGSPVTSPNELQCDSDFMLMDGNGNPFCTQGLFTPLGGTTTEIAQPTPIPNADITTSRWDFASSAYPGALTAAKGASSVTLSLVMDCIPIEFAADYNDGQGHSVCTNNLSLPGAGGANTQFLVVVSNGSPTPLMAGTLQIPPAPAAANDTLLTARAITTNSFSDFISTVATNPGQVLLGSGAGNEIDSQGDPAPPCSPYPARVFRSVWYTYAPTQTSQVGITTANSRYDTVLLVFTGPESTPTTVACNDDASLGVRSSSVNFTAAAGTTYNIMVSECPSDVGTILQNGNQVPAAIPLSDDPTLAFSMTAIPLGNPVPFVDILNPASTEPETTMPTLKISGAGFVSGATVNFNGTELTPSSISTNEIVLENVVAPVKGVTASVSVVNPNSKPSVATFLPVTVPTTGVTFSDTPTSTNDPVFVSSIADVNGDGKLDVILFDETNANTILTLLGNGDGTFQTPIPTTFPGQNGYTTTVVGDFNGDGKIDLATATFAGSSGPGAIVVLLGNGDGTFTGQIGFSLPCCANLNVLVPGDFNGDGILDLVAYGQNAPGTMFLGNGDGTFRQGEPILSGNVFLGAVTGDFNGDGKLDLAVVNSGGVSILMGDGDGTFQNAVSYPAGSVPWVLTTGDFNKDGNLDLAVTNAPSGNGSVSILLGNGDGTFQPYVGYPVGPFPSLIVSGDLNGDGYLDLITLNTISNTMSLLLGNGDGTFQAAVQLGGLEKPTAVGIGDFNGDGRLDLFTTDYDLYNSGYEIFLQQTPQVFLSPTSLTFAAQSVSTLSAPKPITLTNTGTAPLTVSSIMGSGDFKQTNNCGGSIGIDGFCTINVIFNPTNPGTIEGAITITDNASTRPQLVALSGLGVAPLTLSPGSLAFGTVAVGQTSAPSNVTMTNNAPKTQNIIFVASGNFAAVGSGRSPCGASLASGASCTMSVTFTPTANGSINGAVTVTDHTVAPQQEVYLSGTGTGGPTAPLTFSPTALTFTKQAFDTTSPARMVTVTNGSASSVTISTIVSSGNFSNTGVGATPCSAGTILRKNQACTMNVTFTPTYLGTIKGAVVVTDNASVGQQVLDISGSAVLPATVSPLNLTFPAQTVGTTSSSQTITLTNNLTTTLSNIVIAVSGDFSVANSTCGTTLAANGNCSFAVMFTPGQVGSVVGSVTVADSGFNSPQVVNLSGTGQ